MVPPISGDIFTLQTAPLAQDAEPETPLEKSELETGINKESENAPHVIVPDPLDPDKTA